MSSLFNNAVHYFTDYIDAHSANEMEYNSSFLYLFRDIMHRYVEKEGLEFELKKGETHYRWKITGCLNYSLDLDAYSVEKLDARYKTADEFLLKIRNEIINHYLSNDAYRHGPQIVNALRYFWAFLMSGSNEVTKQALGELWSKMESEADCEFSENDEILFRAVFDIYKEMAFDYALNNESFASKVKEAYYTATV